MSHNVKDEPKKGKMLFRFIVTDGEDTKIDVSSPNPTLVKKLLDVWIDDKSS
jgi:hypothetical protein